MPPLRAPLVRSADHVAEVVCLLQEPVVAEAEKGEIMNVIPKLTKIPVPLPEAEEVCPDRRRNIPAMIEYFHKRLFAVSDRLDRVLAVLHGHRPNPGNPQERGLGIYGELDDFEQVIMLIEFASEELSGAFGAESVGKPEKSDC